MIIVMALGIFFNTRLKITKSDGFILLVIAVIYFAIPIIDFIKRGNKQNLNSTEEKEESNKMIIKDFIYIVLGGFALKLFPKKYKPFSAKSFKS